LAAATWAAALLAEAGSVEAALLAEAGCLLAEAGSVDSVEAVSREVVWASAASIAASITASPGSIVSTNSTVSIISVTAFSVDALPSFRSSEAFGTTAIPIAATGGTLGAIPIAGTAIQVTPLTTLTMDTAITTLTMDITIPIMDIGILIIATTTLPRLS